MCLPLRDKDMGDRDRQIPRSAQVSLVCVVEFLTVGVTACCYDKISQKSNSVKGGMVWLAVQGYAFHPGGEGMAAGGGCYIIYLVKKLREECICWALFLILM